MRPVEEPRPSSSARPVFVSCHLGSPTRFARHPSALSYRSFDGDAPTLAEQVAKYDAPDHKLAKAKETIRRFMTMPGAGPVTALAFANTTDDLHRFSRAQMSTPISTTLCDGISQTNSTEMAASPNEAIDSRATTASRFPTCSSRLSAAGRH
jgi:hypothetical protein